MAQDIRSGDTASRNFDNMSNDDLIAYIGGDIDPGTSRSELLTMAMEADQSRRGQPS